MPQGELTFGCDWRGSLCGDCYFCGRYTALPLFVPKANEHRTADDDRRAAGLMMLARASWQIPAWQAWSVCKSLQDIDEIGAKIPAVTSEAATASV